MILSNISLLLSHIFQGNQLELLHEIECPAIENLYESPYDKSVAYVINTGVILQGCIAYDSGSREIFTMSQEAGACIGTQKSHGFIQVRNYLTVSGRITPSTQVYPGHSGYFRASIDSIFSISPGNRLNCTIHNIYTSKNRYTSSRDYFMDFPKPADLSLTSDIAGRGATISIVLSRVDNTATVLIANILTKRIIHSITIGREVSGVAWINDEQIAIACLPRSASSNDGEICTFSLRNKELKSFPIKGMQWLPGRIIAAASESNQFYLRYSKSKIAKYRLP